VLGRKNPSRAQGRRPQFKLLKRNFNGVHVFLLVPALIAAATFLAFGGVAPKLSRHASLLLASSYASQNRLKTEFVVIKLHVDALEAVILA
jgi:hypothetical protein